MDELEYWGEWYKPRNPEAKIFGRLTFSDQAGIHLELCGAFEGTEQEKTVPEFNMELPPKNFPIILGETTEAKLLTLYECVRVESTKHWHNASDKMLDKVEERYRVDYAFIDVHFSDQTEAAFYKADLQYLNLEDWAQVQVFKTQEGISQGNLERYDLSYQRPQKITASVPHGAISVVFRFHHQFSSPHEVSLHQTTHLQIELREALSIDEWRSTYVYHLQNLLSLATTRPHPITDLVVYSRSKTTRITTDKSFDTPIHVIFSQRYYEPKMIRPLYPGEMIFTLQDIKDDFSDKLSKWLQISDPENFGGICDLFFSVIYSPSIYLPHAFLSVVAAVESYHRRQFNRPALPHSEFKRRKDIVIGSAPPECRDWLEGQLFRNHLPFRERINDMVIFASPVVGRLIADQDYFVKKVQTTRNLLVHNIEEHESEAAKGQELRWIAETLSYVVHTCLLTELGFSTKRCFELFSRNSEYQFAAEQAPKFTRNPDDSTV
jgi:hypothetical protein